MKKTIFIILVPVVAIIGVFLLIGFPKVEDINKEISKINQQCPVSNDEYVTLENVVYEEKSKDLIFNLLINEKVVGREYLVNAVNWLKSYDWPEKLTEDGELHHIVKALSHNNGALHFCYKGDISGVTIVMTLSPEEILELADKPLTPEQRVERSANFVNMMCNAQFPAEATPGITVIKGFDDGENIMFICKVDETVHDMDSIVRHIPQMKEALKRELESNSVGEYLHFISHGIGCRYRGVPSDRAAEFTLTASDLSGFSIFVR